MSFQTKKKVPFELIDKKKRNKDYFVTSQHSKEQQKCSLYCKYYVGLRKIIHSRWKKMIILQLVINNYFLACNYLKND